MTYKNTGILYVEGHFFFNKIELLRIVGYLDQMTFIDYRYTGY